jgi:hypothetical protein
MPSHAKRCREANGEPFVTRTPKEERDYKTQCKAAKDHHAACEAERKADQSRVEREEKERQAALNPPAGKSEK